MTREFTREPPNGLRLGPDLVVGTQQDVDPAHVLPLMHSLPFEVAGTGFYTFLVTVSDDRMMERLMFILSQLEDADTPSRAAHRIAQRMRLAMGFPAGREGYCMSLRRIVELTEACNLFSTEVNAAAIQLLREEGLSDAS